MAKFNAQNYWWIVVIAFAVVGVAAKLVTDQWIPGFKVVGDFLVLALIGASFCWAYSIDRERLWWAIIPGLGALTLLGAGGADFFGTDPQNDWMSVLVIGIGAAIIGAVLKRTDAKLVLVIVAMFVFLVGFAMAPITIELKGILIAADILVAVFFLWRIRSTAPKVA